MEGALIGSYIWWRAKSKGLYIYIAFEYGDRLDVGGL